MSLAPMTALNPVRCRGEHRQLSPNHLNQHDEREQTDYGYAQCGNGFDDRAVLGQSHHRRSVGQNQSVCQQPRAMILSSTWALTSRQTSQTVTRLSRALREVLSHDVLRART
jgi:hypothetical protein